MPDLTGDVDMDVDPPSQPALDETFPDKIGTLQRDIQSLMANFADAVAYCKHHALPVANEGEPTMLGTEVDKASRA